MSKTINFTISRSKRPCQKLYDTTGKCEVEKTRSEKRRITDETLRAGKLTPSHICSKQESATRKNKSILSNLDVNVPIFSLLQ